MGNPTEPHAQTMTHIPPNNTQSRNTLSRTAPHIASPIHAPDTTPPPHHPHNSNPPQLSPISPCQPQTHPLTRPLLILEILFPPFAQTHHLVDAFVVLLANPN